MTRSLAPTDGVRSEANKSRVWDPGDDAMIDIDSVTKSCVC